MCMCVERETKSEREEEGNEEKEKTENMVKSVISGFGFVCFFFPIFHSAFTRCLYTLVWKIPWTEEPGGLQSMGSRRVG